MSQSNWTILHSRLHQTLNQRKLLPRHSRLLVAVSGGQDSVCLSKLLLDLQPKWQWEIAIAHCDHCWSTDGGMADHVRQLAQDWGLPFYLRKATTNLPETEAAAREWRYRVLTAIAQEQNFTIIVTGHTSSDRAETLLYNLIRGAGTDGLAALTWKRCLTEKIQLVRPLLTISRLETSEFCEKFQLPIWEDAVNQNLKYARNRIRNELLPYLKTHFNPQVETNLAQTAEILSAEATYLEAGAEEKFQEVITADGQSLNRLLLKNYPPAIQRRIIRQFIQKNSKKAANFAQIEALIQLIEAPNRSRTSSLPGSAVVEVQGELIVYC